MPTENEILLSIDIFKESSTSHAILISNMSNAMIKLLDKIIILENRLSNLTNKYNRDYTLARLDGIDIALKKQRDLFFGIDNRFLELEEKMAHVIDEIFNDEENP